MHKMQYWICIYSNLNYIDETHPDCGIVSHLILIMV